MLQMYGTLTVVLATSLLAPRVGAQRHVALADVRRIVRVSGAALSPDGRTVAVTVTRRNYTENRAESELYAVDVATAAARRLETGSPVFASTQFSPDGAALTLLAPDSAGQMQIWVLQMAGGRARKLTSHSTGVSDYRWRPDGGAIAFTAEDSEPRRDGEARFLNAVKVGDQDLFQLQTPRPQHLWLADAATGQSRRLTSGDWTVEIALGFQGGTGLSWSPDGGTIAFPRMITPESGKNDSTYIALLDVSSGAIRPLTTARRFQHNPVFSPDGRSVVYSYPRNGSVKSFWGGDLWLAPVSDGAASPTAPRSMTHGLDRHVFSPRWLPDGRSVLVVGDDRTSVGAWIQPVSGPARRLDVGTLVIVGSLDFDVTVARRAPTIAFTATEPGRPAELYVMDTPTARPRQLTHFNEWANDVAWGRVERVTWKTDRFEADGVVGYPPNFSPSKRYPLVLMLHGGPETASLAGFSALGQLLAAQEWIVFQPNYRGSDNLGSAYMDALIDEPGAGPGRDVMAGVAMMRKRAYVDRSKTAATGWSYGGFMTTWLIGNYPGEWTAAVAGAPVTNWVDEYNLSDGNVTTAFLFGGSPYTGDRMRRYRAQSPLTFAPRVRAPTLLMANMEDPNVPTTEPLTFFHALRDNGVETEFIAFPGRGHSPADPVNALEVYRLWIDWVKRHFEARP